MRRTHMIAVFLVAVLIGSARTPAQSSGEVALRAAMETETVKGDLKAAIEQYQQIAAGADRALAVRALLRMAQCYQKLGDAESKRIYERIVRDYADQKEAVSLAQAGLGGTRPALRAGDRAIWTGRFVDMFGQVSPDGRLISYVDWVGTFNLMVHDVVTNTDRPLTNLPSMVNNPKWEWQGEASYSTFSKDGRQIAYGWMTGDAVEIRIVDARGTSFSTPRTVLSIPDSEVRWLSPFDWSSDGNWLAVALSRRDGTGQIARVSLADGKIQTLKSVDWKGPQRIFFSPDSRFLAFDLAAAGSTGQRDIYVMATDASRESPAVVHEANESLFGWSPDGRYLLFASNRTGSTGLWGQPMADGRPVGAAELLRADIGQSSFSLGSTAAGSLVVYRKTSSRDVRIAPIDVASGRLTGAPVGFSRGYLDGPRVPDWSRDGKSLAYQACGGSCLAIRSVETGEVTQLPGTLLYPAFPTWSPDGRQFLSAGRDDKGKNGVYVIDSRTGSHRRIVEMPKFGASPQWAPDGTRFYYGVRDSEPAGVIEHELATGRERTILAGQFSWDFVLSPDGKSVVARTAPDPATKTASVLLASTSGAAVREILRVTLPDVLEGARTIAFTPDSSAVLVTKWVNGTQPELWKISLTGEAPRKLDIDAQLWTDGAQGGNDVGFRLSPDGRHIAFLGGKTASEAWAIENLLPPTRGTQR